MTATAPLLEHLGVAYDDPEALVATVGPRVADALSVGDDVYLSVDRRTARGFRDWLGPVGDRVEFPVPTRWPQDLVRDLRAIVRPDRRALVVGQYSASGVVEKDHVELEAGINLVLADLPITVMCTCAHDADPSLLRTLHSQHPDLLVDGAIVANPDYRPPIPARPVPPEVWGPPTLRLPFDAPVDLRRLREHVARLAETVGLRGDSAREAVQATHEAAVLAAGGPEPPVLARAGADVLDGPGSGFSVPCVLEVRADAGVLHCEVFGPRPEAGVGSADCSHDGADPLAVVRLFCDRALMHDEADTRTVRVLHGGAAAAAT